MALGFSGRSMYLSTCSAISMRAMLKPKASLEESTIINTANMRNYLRHQQGKSFVANGNDGRENMVVPSRPSLVLFGSSIVQLSYDRHGWGASLANLYARKADILLRGYPGWNSRMALDIYKKVFPKDAKIQPSLVILYFGGNDSVDPKFIAHPEFPAFSVSVPLDEYVENMRKIALYIKGLSEKTRLIMLSSPAVNEEQIVEYFGNNQGRTNERGRKYSEAGLKLAKQLGVPVVDFWSALYERPNVFWDGMHLTKEGSEILFKKITEVIKEADWEPTLDWDKMPDEFSDIHW